MHFVDAVRMDRTKEMLHADGAQGRAGGGYDTDRTNRSHNKRHGGLRRSPKGRGVQESSPLLKIPRNDDGHDKRNNFPCDPDFQEVIVQAELAIHRKVLPERIAKSTGGSYFVKNCAGMIIGVFKPKDEEPYGHMNPKWLKWLHRTCCPCCFGRGCLVHNQGYLCEAGASVVDHRLRLNIVPKTRVAWLASETFSYSSVDRAKCSTKRRLSHGLPWMERHVGRLGLPRKVGSFQIYVEGFQDADFWLRCFKDRSPPESTSRQFQSLFERLVVLDYVIRNTDREFDNWLIKCNAAWEAQKGVFECSTTATAEIEIAAIDNGLSFPYKHPDEWRAYPYHWAWLPQAKMPFSEEICNQVLPLLSDQNFVQDLCDDLHVLFKVDRSFNHHTFEKQMSVMRGQILNLTQALQEKKSPLQLVQMPVLSVHRKRSSGRHAYTDSDHNTHTYSSRTPIFSFC